MRRRSGSLVIAGFETSAGRLEIGRRASREEAGCPAGETILAVSSRLSGTVFLDVGDRVPSVREVPSDPACVSSRAIDVLTTVSAGDDGGFRSVPRSETEQRS